MSFLRTYRGLSGAERKRLEQTDTRRLERALDAGVAAVGQESYGPELLRSPAPPPALFVWGDAACLQRPMIAIVGTRGASVYGKAVAQKFAEAFVRAGVVVVSGGAMGIDENAHLGALEAGGQTVAVFANGADVVQPPKNGPLFERIRTQGCLVSPFAVGAPALEFRFKPRNELIAAMSLAVVVVEVPERSGALMTCTAAADLGREVFVVPGTIDRPGFRGSHRLVREGATLVDDPCQVLEPLGIEPSSRAAVASAANERQQSILAALTAEPQAPEKIVVQVGLQASEVLAELTEMELEGLIVRSGTGYAVRP